MKFFRLDLLTLLISLFILNSCKNQDTIGLIGGSANVIGGSLVDTTTVLTNTVAEDTVITSTGVTSYPLGYFNDPVFGTTESNLITDINLPLSGAYTLPTGQIIVDSAIMVLKYADGFYGDSLASKYTVNVYQLLGNRPYTTETYYNNSPWTANTSQLVGTKSFFSRTHDSLRITTIVNGGPDTLIKVPPQLRIRLDTGFIHRILFNAPAAVLASNLYFQNVNKGFFVTMDKTQSTGAGGTFMLTAPADSTIEIYYRAINGSTVDTAQVYLDVSQHIAQVKHNYTPILQNALAHQGDSLLYLQGLGGTRGKIRFPYIQKLFQSIGNNNVVINRAELVLSVDPGSDVPSYLVPQPRLTLYRWDLAHQRVSVEDAESTDPRAYSASIFGGYYILNTNTKGVTTKGYHFLITSYIQDLILGRTVDYGTYVAPCENVDATTIPIAATVATGGRVIVGGVNNNASYHAKLNVIYTRINKQ